MAAPEPEDSDDDMFASAMAFGSETAEAEKEYDKILELLREAEGMKMYCDVYTKLYDTYYTNKERYSTLMAEMDVVQAKMRKFDATVADYQQEIREANKTIAKLNGDIDEARALADAMHARELMSVESLETLKRTAARLEKELDARKRAGDDEGATSAVKEKEKFEKEKAKLQLELDGTRLRLENAINYQEEMEHRVAVAEETINKQEEQLEEAENQAVRTHRMVDHLQQETTNLAGELEVRGNTISSLSEKLSKADKTIERRDKTVKELTHKLDFSKQEQESAVQRATTLRFKLDKLQVEHSKCATDLVNQTKETNNLHLITRDQKMEIAKYHKQVVQLAKKLQLMEQSKGTVVGDRDQLRQQVSVMEREITLNKKEAESNRRIVENANREKEILNKQMQMIQNDAQENLEMMQLQENHRKQQDHELEQNSKQITKQRLIIRQLEKDKDRMLEETIALNEKIDEVADEVRMRVADIVDLKKALREENINNRKLTAALDFTRSERNMLHKNYTEALDEIMDLKQKLKMLAYQIEQLKEDITGKETGLRSCEGLLAKCTKKCESLRMDIQVGHVKLSESRADIAALRQEEARLNRIVQEGDSARMKLVKELEGLMNERDVVGAQLVRRNDEISLLYEKIRILEITLHRGERQYEQRVEDIRLLRLEIIRLRKEKNLLSKGIENMTDLRLEVFNLERELGRERLRVRALEEALETPLNVHRWRKLQGTDPESVHLTQKLRLTQKKVLRQSEMLVMKDRELKETKNLYGAVKDMLALQPSPEIQQTLNRTQRALTQRTSKLKCLVAELQMRERQVSDLRHELDRSTDELNSFKNKYYDIKRALDADEARRLKIPSPTPASPSAIVLA